jgi:hypothetical protein
MGYLRVWWTENKKRIKGTEAPHWSAAVAQECKHNSSFVQLVACFGIATYVKHQAATNPNLLVGVSEGRRIVLRDAVHGFRASKDEVIGPFIAKYGSIESDLAGRVEIVRFLLDEGGSTRRINFDELWDFVSKAKAKSVDCDALISVLKRRESVKRVVSSAVQRFVYR